MRIRSNKGYIQGELNLVDIHDQFDISDRTDYIDTQIGSDGNTWMCCDGNTSMCYEGKHPR